MVGGPESELMIGEVFTGALGAKGVSHDVTVATRKKTALVCTLSGAVAKGKATLEVVLAGEEPDTYRFTASRKVTVR